MASEGHVPTTRGRHRCGCGRFNLQEKVEGEARRLGGCDILRSAPSKFGIPSILKCRVLFSPHTACRLNRMRTGCMRNVCWAQM